MPTTAQLIEAVNGELDELEARHGLSGAPIPKSVTTKQLAERVEGRLRAIVLAGRPQEIPRQQLDEAWIEPEPRIEYLMLFVTVTAPSTAFTPPSNQNPVWNVVPNPVTFVEGSTGQFPGSGTYQSNAYVTDPDGDPLSVSKNSVFVQGVVWDGGKFTFDGTGTAQVVGGHVLTANDGRGGIVPSSQFTITITAPTFGWSSTPSVTYYEGRLADVDLSPYLIGYNQSTDVVSVSPSSPALPAWLTFTGTNNRYLRATGTQVDANDLLTAGTMPVLRVTRGAQVSDSDPIPVTVLPPTVLSTTLTLTSAAGGTLLPFSFGHAFKQADVPSGANVVAEGLSTFQCTPKTYWPDGSLKFGIVAGRATLSQNIATPITLTTGTASGGTALTSSDIQAAAPTASVQCGAIGTVSLASLLGSPFRTWISGPQMVECHYRADVGGGTNLSVWFHVRLWANGTLWIRAICENGYLDNGAGAISAHSDQTFVPTVIIGGTTVYSNGGASLTHYRNTRWMAEGWIGTNPQITPKHDVAYLKSTKLVPGYFWTTPTEAKLNSYTYTYTPMTGGNIPAGMEGQGFSEHIGLLPNWDALYCTTGDARVYRACINNSSAVNSRAIVWRRKSTNLVPTPSEFPTWSLYGPAEGGVGVLGRGTLTYEVHHSPNEGYLAYLLTGDYWHYETMAMSASFAYFGLSSGRGSGVNRLNIQDQIRGIAWSARTVGSYVAVAPQGDAIADDYRNWLSTGHMAHWAGMGPYNVNAKQLGYPFAISTYNPSLPLSQAQWMMHFWIQTQGFLKDIKPGFASTTDQDALTTWMYKGVVGILGGNSTAEYCYTKANFGNIVLSPDIVPYFEWTTPDRFYATWGEVYTATQGVPNTSCGSTLEGSSGGDPSNAATGYWGNLLPAIAYAVDHGATGAQTAWNRLTSATNWSAVAGSGFDNTPIWGVTPRNYSALPAWVSALPLWQWYQIPNTNLSGTPPTVTAYGNPAGKITAWCGAALKRSGSVYIVGMSGGHADYSGNEINALTLNAATPQWREVISGTPQAQQYDSSPFNADLRGASTHTYYYSQFIDSLNRFVSFTNPGTGFGAGGPPSPPGGWPYTGSTWSPAVNWATLTYEAPTYVQQLPSAAGDWTSAMCAKHPTTGDVYISRSGGSGWWKFTSSTLQWTLQSSTAESNYCGSAIDPTRNQMLIVGDYSQTSNPRVRNLSGAAQSVTFGGLGVAALKGDGSKECGVVYDEANDTFLMITNTDPIGIKRVRASDFFVDVPTTTGTAPARRPNGILNAAQYVPELRGVVIANSYTGNVYFIRTAL